MSHRDTTAETESPPGRISSATTLSVGILALPITAQAFPWVGELALRIWISAWRLLAEPITIILWPEAQFDWSFIGRTSDTALQWSILAVNLLVGTIGGTWLTHRKIPSVVPTAIGRAVASLAAFALGTSLISYGLAKVFLQQFPAPEADRLLSQFGEASLFQLLWTCQGAAPAYSIFGGAVEIASGVAVLVPAWRILGAMLACAVMANVVALNFAYDLPVKALSLQLLGLSAWLSAPVLGRLVRWSREHATRRGGGVRSALWVWRGALGLFVVTCVLDLDGGDDLAVSRWAGARRFGDAPEDDVADGRGSGSHWQSIGLNRHGRGFVRFRDGTRSACALREETEEGFSLELNRSGHRSSFAVRVFRDDTGEVWEWSHDGAVVRARVTLIDPAEWRLRQPARWIWRSGS